MFRCDELNQDFQIHLSVFKTWAMFRKILTKTKKVEIVFENKVKTFFWKHKDAISEGRKDKMRDKEMIQKDVNNTVRPK